MNQAEAWQRLTQLGVPAFETRDAAALLGITRANASLLLGRMAARDLVARLGRGAWTLGRTSPGQRAELLAAPYPTYVSLLSAMFRHGMIEQVPAITYAVTLGRARMVRTPQGAVSLHRLPPALFGGFEETKDGEKLATAEKALFDWVYLGPTRSRLFVKLPELEVPKGFQWAETARWTKRIPGKSRRKFVESKLAELREQARRSRAS
jgi:predicted transcriptional regulator of viral defense system